MDSISHDLKRKSILHGHDDVSQPVIAHGGSVNDGNNAMVVKV
jgi:hypothetical protein